MIELAVSVDMGEPFVLATYKLEGDGPLVLECYEILSRVKAAVQICYLPNTAAVAVRIVTTTMSEQYWVTYAKACTQPGFDYFSLQVLC